MRSLFARTACLVLGGSVLLLAVPHESLAAPPVPAKRPVAEVLGEKLYREELAPEAAARSGDVWAKKALEDEQGRSRYELQQLQSRLLRPLLKAYAREQKLEATPEEVREFNAGIPKEESEDLGTVKEELARVRKELEDPALSEQARKAAGALAAELEAFIARDPKNADIGVKDYLNDSIARGFIIAWKVQRALHRQYGGDIIFQQSGPEAVGAYAPFLKEREKAGDFIIHDEALRRRFHEFMLKPPGTRLKDPNALETPFWKQRGGQERNPPPKP